MQQCKIKWKKKLLGDLGYTYSGLSNKTIDDFGSGENFIPYLNIYKNPIIKTDEFEKVKIGLNERQNQVQKGDVFFTTSSETPDEVGLTSVLVEKIDKSLYLNSFCFGYRLNNDKEFNNKFLAYLLRGEIIRSQISKMAQGSTRYNLSKTQLLSKLNLYYPFDSKEQEKIAQILSTCDSVIEKTEETIEKYKQIKAGVMQDLFTRGLDEDGKLRPKYQNAPELYKYSEELGRYIPKDWEVKTFKDICYVNQGLQIAISSRHRRIAPNRYLYITIQYLNTLKNPEYIEKPQSSVICSKEDILMTRTGNTGFVVTGVEGVFHNNFFKINYNKELLDKNYIIYFLKQEEIQKMILDKAGLTTIPDLSHGDFYSLPILLLKKYEQINISNILLDIDKKICLEDRFLKKYKQIKQGLMKKLLTPPADAEIVEE